MKLGEKIKKLRNEAGLTQPELAEKAQIEQSYLSKLENEKGSPSFEVIEKIAQAFDLTAMTLIESLEFTYIQQQLNHLPEIAVKISEQQRLQENKIKRLYIVSVALILFGVAVFFAGNRAMFISNHVYEYYSAGLINEGEPLERFYRGRIHLIKESGHEHEQRIKENRSRLAEIHTIKSRYKGENYVEHYGKQKRYFSLVSSKGVIHQANKMHELLGILFFISGWFLMFFIYRSGRK